MTNSINKNLKLLLLIFNILVGQDRVGIKKLQG